MRDTQRKHLDRLLSIEITHPCPYHPAGRNQLLLNPQERAEIIRRVEIVEIMTQEGERE